MQPSHTLLRAWLLSPLSFPLPDHAEHFLPIAPSSIHQPDPCLFLEESQRGSVLHRTLWDPCWSSEESCGMEESLALLSISSQENSKLLLTALESREPTAAMHRVAQELNPWVGS